MSAKIQAREEEERYFTRGSEHTVPLDSAVSKMKLRQMSPLLTCGLSTLYLTLKVMGQVFDIDACSDIFV